MVDSSSKSQANSVRREEWCTDRSAATKFGVGAFLLIVIGNANQGMYAKAYWILAVVCIIAMIWFGWLAIFRKEEAAD